jgi:hypothetical protein
MLQKNKINDQMCNFAKIILYTYRYTICFFIDISPNIWRGLIDSVWIVKKYPNL